MTRPIDTAGSPGPGARRVRPGAFRALLAFTFVTGVTQLLWLNFAPLIAYLMERYGVDELTASTLILVFPLLYVFLSMHAGALVDRIGYRATVGRGAIATAAFAALRIFDDHFATLLAAQIGLAIAQPYVGNGISKLVASHFDESQGAIATGIGTIGMFLGMALAMALTPPLVEAAGFRTAMAVFAAIAAVAAAVFYAATRGAGGPSSETTTAPAPTIRALLANRDLALVFAMAFLGLGFFNGLTTWLEQILAPNGLDAEAAGLVGAALIVGGIVGSGVLPALSDRAGRRKPFVLVCTLVATVTLVPLCTSRDFGLLVALAGVLGFFFLPAYALLLEMCSELAGRASAGYATGVLMLAGNAGGVVVIVAMPLVKGDAPTFLRAVYLLLGLLVAAIGLASIVSETHHARATRPEGGAPDASLSS